MSAVLPRTERTRVGDICSLDPALRTYVVGGKYMQTVTVDGSTFPRCQFFTRVIEAACEADITVADVVPHDGYSVQMGVQEAAQVEAQPVYMRHAFRPQMRALLMHRAARKAGKPVSMLVPWVDYDTVSIDEELERWACGRGVRFAGD